MSQVIEIKIGSKLRRDDQTWVVTGLDGRGRVTLRGSTASSYELRSVADLLADPDVVVLDAGHQGEAASVGIVLAQLSAAQTRDLAVKTRHVLEVLTGSPTGDRDAPRQARPGYGPGTTLSERQRAKASELGVHPDTIRGWCRRYSDTGPEGLVDARSLRGASLIDRLDPTWVSIARQVLADQTPKSRRTKQSLLREITAIADAESQQRPRPVVVPSKTNAYQALSILDKGKYATYGSTSRKRSAANGPQRAYGSLRATRPGEYWLLDTTRLDVFAMEPVTMRWIQCELSICIDAYSHAITGLVLTPVSTNATDIASVLYEAIVPRDDDQRIYQGLPDAIAVDGSRVQLTAERTLRALRKRDPVLLRDQRGQPLTPGAPEAIVVDHGRIYIGLHVRSVCQQLGMSIFLCRPGTPTDKAVVERIFRSIRQLLEELPGYKGSNVYERGENPEAGAYYMLDELEAILRDWVREIYHPRAHDGLALPESPGLALSPLEMHEIGQAKRGTMRLPRTADLLLGFLPVKFRTIQHYGVEINGLRYDSPVLDEFRNLPSPLGGRADGKWAFRLDPRDVRTAFFQHPETGRWHPLRWQHYRSIPEPFSAEVAQRARNLAATAGRHIDVDDAVKALLADWASRSTLTRSERRLLLRRSQELDELLANVADLTGNAEQRADRTSDETPPLPDPGGDPDAESLDEATPDDYYDGTWEAIA